MWQMTTGEILIYSQVILSSHHLLLVLFKMSCQLIYLFVSTKTNFALAYLQLKRNRSWWYWLKVGQDPQDQVGL